MISILKIGVAIFREQILPYSITITSGYRKSVSLFLKNDYGMVCGVSGRLRLSVLETSAGQTVNVDGCFGSQERFLDGVLYLIWACAGYARGRNGR